MRRYPLFALMIAGLLLAGCPKQQTEHDRQSAEPGPGTEAPATSVAAEVFTPTGFWCEGSDPHNRNYTALAAPLESPVKVWTHQLDMLPTGRLGLSAQGDILITASAVDSLEELVSYGNLRDYQLTDYRSALIALDPTGEELWRHEAQAELSFAASANPDPRIYTLEISKEMMTRLEGGSKGDYDQLWLAGRLLALGDAGAELWSVDTGGSGVGSPIVDEQGMAYLTRLESIYSGRLDYAEKGSMAAFSPQGVNRFSYPLPPPGYGERLGLTSQVRLGTAGELFISWCDARLYALSTGNERLWQVNFPKMPETGPAVSPSGQLLQFINLDPGLGDDFEQRANWGERNNYGVLLVRQPNSVNSWEVTVSSDHHTPLAIAGDGTIYLATSLFAATIDTFTETGTLISITPEGRANWRLGTGRRYGKLPWQPAPLMCGNGVLLLPDRDGWLSAISEEGEIIWEYQASARIITPPVMAQDGLLLFATEDGVLHGVR